MEYCLYKQKRDEMIKFLFNTGNTVGQISGRLAIDEDLVRSVLGVHAQVRVFNKRKHKSLDVRDPLWN